MAHSYAQLIRSCNGLWARIMPTLHKMVYWTMIPTLFFLGKLSSFSLIKCVAKGTCVKPRSPYLEALLEMLGITEKP